MPVLHLACAKMERVWRPHPRLGWTLGDVVAEDALTGAVTVFPEKARGETEATSFGGDEVHRYDASHGEDLDNIADMNNVHEAPLLDLLRRRYAASKIYTFTGEILISINPYRDVKGLYEANEAGDIGRHAAPHLFTVAARALECLRANPEERQTIVINGESGAGKTEASKIIIKFLGAQRNNEAAADEPPALGAGAPLQAATSIEEHLVKTNVLLEQFGNAKTVRNDNSSRFGKYIRLACDPETLALHGAHISYFLLEASRLVGRGPEERNFHVLYALCHGLSDAERESLGGLEQAPAYRYLRGAGQTDQSDQVSYAASWRDLRASLDLVGLEAADVLDLCRALKLVLELGNVKVGELERSSTQCAGESDQNEASNAQNVRVAKVDPVQPALCAAAKILGVSADSLARTLAGRMVTINSARASIEWVELSRAQCEESINSLAKAVYCRLFDWLVAVVNRSAASAASAASTSNAVARQAAASATGSIGILDIYGFEILETNSLEQLCINFANERLQRQFNAKVFDAEQQRYLAEGVQWTLDQFGVDNQPCIDLIGNARLGVLSILDEQTLMLYHASGVASATNGADSTRAVEEQLLAKLHKALDRHSHYIKPRIAKPSFLVRHFAGVVEYDVTGFPKKNTDSLHPDMVLLLNSSTAPFLKTLFHEDIVLLGRERIEQAQQARRRVFKPNKLDEDNLTELDRKLARRRSSPVHAAVRVGPAALPGPEVVRLKEADVDTTPSIDDNLFGRGTDVETAASAASTRKFAARNTVTARFRRQLTRLMDILDEARPHYIRCIKPNADKQPNTFDAKLVLEQLRYIGVLETVRIRKSGYPVSHSFEALAAALRALLPAGSDDSPRSALRRMLQEHLPGDAWQLGNSRVFLKDRQMELLQAAANRARAKHVATIQAAVRGLRARHRVAALRTAATVLQTAARRATQARRWRAARRAAKTLQRLARRRAARRREAAATVAQSFVRAVHAKAELGRLQARLRAVVILQRVARGAASRRGRCNLHSARSAAGVLQRAWRALWRNKLLRTRTQSLHRAAQKGDLDSLSMLCEFLVESVAELDMRGVRLQGAKFQTLLHSAAQSGHLPTLEYVLQSDAGQWVQHYALHDSVDADGNTVLHAAAAASSCGVGISLCSVVVDAASLGAGTTDAPTPSARAAGAPLKGFLLKSRKGAKFQRRFVVLDAEQRTLSYYRSSRDKTPRFQVNLGPESGAKLALGTRHKACFEITSPELVKLKGGEGRLHFKCKNQKELQLWVSKLRQLNGLRFNAKLPTLDKLGTISWQRVEALVTRRNDRLESAVHAAAKASTEAALYLVALTAFRGPAAVRAALHGQDLRGRTPKHHAEEAGRHDVVDAFDRLSAYLDTSDVPVLTGRQSITPQRIISGGTNGGTFLSLFLDYLQLPVPVTEKGGVVMRITVVNLGAAAPTGAGAGAGPRGAQVMRPSRQVRDLVEDPTTVHPLHIYPKDLGARLVFGAMWHMQSPLEQLGAGVCVVLQVIRDKKVIGTLHLPFEARSIGIGGLSPGLHELKPASAAQVKQSLLARTWQSMASIARARTVHADDSRQGSGKSHKGADAPRPGLLLGAKVMYSVRSAPGRNCFAASPSDVGAGATSSVGSAAAAAAAAAK